VLNKRDYTQDLTNAAWA